MPKHHSILISRMLRSSAPRFAFFVMLAVVFPVPGVLAGDILRGGMTSGAAAQGAQSEARNRAADAAAAAARQRANDRLAATTRAITGMEGAQAAARAAAAAALSTVPNGLAVNGLDPLMIPDPADRGKFKFHRWDGADAPTQNGFDVNIRQTAAQAVLHWRTFNVGRDTTLNFDQSAGGAEAGKWTVLNKIFDPKGRITEIYGRIQGQGQVHIINRTGFIFHAGSSVDARSIVVSSLPINDNLVERGLINQNPKNVQFLFSGLAKDGFDRDLDLDGNGAIEAGKDYLASTPSGDVTIEAGARLAAETSAEKVGGRITLAGANVRNKGTLSTPDGQTIIAAGRQVGFDAHPTTDPTLRGLDVYVGEVDNTSGEAVNTGLIDAPRANVTMAGKRVRQLGVIKSATSTALNGRVDLLANFNAKTYTDVTGEGNDYPSAQASTTPLFYNGESGTVELGPGSLIAILPDSGSKDRAVGTKLALGSLVNIQGRAIHLGAGSVIHAPGASLPSGGTLAVDGSRDSGSGRLLAGVTARAGNWIRRSAAGDTFWANSDRKLADDGQPYVGGQIFLDRGAVIDVAGSVDVHVPLSHKLLTLQMRGAELANSPLQRNGALRGTSITVDMGRSGTYNGQFWMGTPLGDVSGYAGIIERNVGQLTVAGGTVNLTAGEAVIMQSGSIIDVSGGTSRVAGGKVQTTRLIYQGRLVDIADATPDRLYEGIFTGKTTATSAKWGVSKTYRNALAPLGEYVQRPYYEGAEAGEVAINAAAVALDGQLRGRATQGPRQINPSERNFAAPPSLAKGGSLQINIRNQGLFNRALVDQSPTAPTLSFALGENLPAADPFEVSADGVVSALREERKRRLSLSPTLLTDAGFSDLSIDNSEGSIDVPAGAPLSVPVLGSVSMSAANISIGAPITAPGGNLSFTVYNYSPYDFRRLNGTIFEPPTPDPDPGRGIFALASGATLSTAGLVTDRRPGFAARDAGTIPLVNGGSISINAFTARLDAGSVIDASGGVAVSSTGRRNFGSGGNISIAAGNDPLMKWLVGGKLFLGSALRSYSGGRLSGVDANGNSIYPGDSRFRGYMDGSRLEAKGGELSIQAPAIQVGGAAPAGMADGDLLHLGPDFFTRGGFTAYNLTGLTVRGGNLPGVLIAPGTVIEPSAENWRLSRVGGKTTLQPFRRTDGLAPPVSISFNSPVLRDDWDATGALVSRGDIVMGAGARIQTLPSASVRFQGGTVAILGSVFAPGGNITVRGADSFPLPVASDLRSALPTVNLGPQSVLSAAGTTVSLSDPFGRKAGRVLPGGSITVAGNIVAEAGSVLDVSGTSGVFDVHPSRLVKNILSEPRNGSRVPPNSGVTTSPFAIRGVSTRIESDAGRIALLGSQELFVDATLRGFAGGPSAQGGRLVIFSGRFIDAGLSPGALDKNLIVRQSGNFIPGSYYPAGQTAIGNMVPVADGSSALGRGWFAVDRFTSGGFDSLKLSGGLQGAVSFEGPVSIAARRSLDVAEGGVIFADAAVDLSAPYIKVGTAFQPPVRVATAAADDLKLPSRTYEVPTSGPGTLGLRGSLIDIGKLSLQGISTANFNASEGDIRGNGALNIAGTLNLSAGQIYPTTASLFTIAAYDPNIIVLSSSTASRTVQLASDKLPAGFGVGTPFLGSTVASVAGDTVTLASEADTDINSSTLVVFAPGEGRVNVAGGARRALPLSAGGTLNIYASQIQQSGTLRAPFGTINLGWDGLGARPKDYLTGAGILPGRDVPITRQLALAAGSVTSVSGQGLVVPYGFSSDGDSWIDPTGTDITGSGPPVKTVNLSSLNLSANDGSLIDVSGGGDLYAYRWVQGNGGSLDILGSPSADWSASTSYQSGQLVLHEGSMWSARRANQGVRPSVGLDWTRLPEGFAVLPGYDFAYAPYGVFNQNAQGESGYGSSGLSVGDKIYIGPGSLLSAGEYTLLPARYALLPGGVFVSSQTTSLFGATTTAEGASIVSGYRFNGLHATAPRALAERFEVVGGSALRKRAQYDGFFASSHLKESAERLGLPVPRLPQDAGRVAVSALNSLCFDGAVAGRGGSGGSGAEIDLGTLQPIRIAAPGGVAPAGTVLLDASKLSSYGADSILVGGTRRATAAGTSIAVSAARITVDNAGSALSAPEIILAAKENLEIAPGARITQSGTSRGRAASVQPSLLIGDAATARSGNGTLLRVSDVQTPLVRSGVSSQADQAGLASPPQLTVGAGAVIAGPALTLDSTYATDLDPASQLVGESVALQSGKISMRLDNSVPLGAAPGLVLADAALQGLRNSATLSLLSYSSIDLYGAGRFAVTGSLSLDAGQIRAFTAGSVIELAAPEVTLGNSSGADSSVAPGGETGALLIDTGTLRLGAGNLSFQKIAGVELQADNGVVAEANGQLSTPGDLILRAPVLTSSGGSYAITANGAVEFGPAAGASTANPATALGATLSVTGTRLAIDSSIRLPSGSLTLRATEGDVAIGTIGLASIDAGGTQRTLDGVTKYTDGGTVRLLSDQGSVRLGVMGSVDVSANNGGGNAGSVNIGAGRGTFAFVGSLAGSAAAGGGGSFFLDAEALPNVSTFDIALNTAGFTGERSYRARNEDVEVTGVARARSYAISADRGSINLRDGSFIDASGETGGTVRLSARDNVTLESGARISARGENFNSAGQGGSVMLESGSTVEGVASTTGFVDIQAGSIIDLSVNANTPSSAAEGKFTGRLHIRAPQNAVGSDLLVRPILGTIAGASGILAEGVRVYDLSFTSGAMTSSGSVRPLGGLMTAGNNLRESIRVGGENFLGVAGATTPRYSAMLRRLLGVDDPAGLGSIFVLAPGAEVVNRAGSLTLGSETAAAASDWNLSAFRFGPKSAPGMLTLRASGDIAFLNPLSDGFVSSAYDAVLRNDNTALPDNMQSWSYRIVAGSDFGASDFRRTTAPDPGLGSIRIGRANPGTGRAQFVRTGSGSIEMHAARDVQLRNDVATVYTAGTRITDPASLTLGGDFVVPGNSANAGFNNPQLGVAPFTTPPNRNYQAQYTLGGGSIVMDAGGNIERVAFDENTGEFVAASQKQIPNNWLYRRGYIDPATGRFGTTLDGENASTTWWVDFSNFYQGIGALGGGNVALRAAGDISNIDAVAPTTARMTFRNAQGSLLASAQILRETGGGDVSVIAGGNIDAGIYYVERGRGTLRAGGGIVTNPTRTAYADQQFGADFVPLSPEQWLPTTLFLGKGRFDIVAGGDATLGPTLNPFLLPIGWNNSVRRKSYFSTYGTDSAVDVTSLSGSLTLRQNSAAFGAGTLDSPIMRNWMQPIHLQSFIGGTALSVNKVWLRLGETDLAAFDSAFTVLPGTLRATAFGGDINLAGRFDLSPAPRGTIEISAGGEINGLRPLGRNLAEGDTPERTLWNSAIINLSDADPADLPGVNNPIGLRSSTLTGPDVLQQGLAKFFAESGSLTGQQAVIQTQQALHGRSVLHRMDNEPLRLFAGTGDISGLTLYSPKAARIAVARDVTDVAFYFQNTKAADVSVVRAGRDIVPYNINSLLRLAAQAEGNRLPFSGQPTDSVVVSGITLNKVEATAQAGDIQISGPGSLLVQAGRNLDLGTGLSSADGTRTGITSVGNARNPNLSFGGANIYLGAGLGSSEPAYADFIQRFVRGGEGSKYLAELSSLMAGRQFDDLGAEEQKLVALQVFYLILRDAGREKQKGGGYEKGIKAIDALFPAANYAGDIQTRTRDIRTKSGGDISIFVPGGSLALATAAVGTPVLPPGIVTEAGGNIGIFTDGDVDIGISRIFTLRGGNQIIWSSSGDIAAGASSKTVQSAPPTRVLIDPQTAELKVDLGGLATGGGIGVLASVEGVKPGSVDLIAPEGVVDAGDAGIRATGNLSIAATQVLNADNISAGGASVGVPTAPVVAAPNISGLTAGATANAANNSAAQNMANQAASGADQAAGTPSVITVEVLGYGGPSDQAPRREEEDEENRRSAAL